MTSTAHITIRTQQGDTVDGICWHLYGSKMNGTNLVEQVLQLNHGLADLGAVLPMGLTITVPALTTTTSKREVIQLWT